MLSMVARGRASPSIGTLVAIASALQINMSALFDIDPDTTERVRGFDEHPVFEISTGVTRRIAVNDVARGLEVVANEYEPGTSSSATPVRHNGIEYGIVLEGQRSIELAGEVHDLEPGDSITCESELPHRIINDGKRPARAI